MGGDFAPGHLLEGARLALAEYSAITTLYLVGDAAQLLAADPVQNLGDQGRAADVLGTRGRAAAAQGQLLLGLGQLPFQRLALG